MSDYSGFRELGYVLGGGGKNNPDAYHSGLQTVARSEGMLAEAARKQAERMMFDSLAEQRRRLLQDPALQAGLGWNPGQAALFGASEVGNWQQNTAGQLNVREEAMRARAEQALLGDLGPGYAELAALGGKALPQNTVRGGVVLNEYAADPNIRTTMLGDAEIAADSALAAQRAAAADLYKAKTERPQDFRAQPKAPAANAEAEVLQQARERIANGADPKAVAEHLARKGYPQVAAKIYEPKPQMLGDY